MFASVNKSSIMALVSYPIAKSASDALTKARNGTFARAVRQTDATVLCGKKVEFYTQFVGPEFADLGLAQQTYRGLIDDEARNFATPPEARFCQLVARFSDKAQARLPPAKEIQKNGQRWAKHHKIAPKVWQLSISYWKIITEIHADDALAQARKLRKNGNSETLSRHDLKTMTEQKLVATKPQKALDYGLFDFIPPDDPGIVIADE
jgi:hypothetical protein